MLKNYLLTSFRSLIRHKAFTAINISGLVIGISFSTMLYTYIQHELSYDSFHEKSERTYRILTTDKSNPADVRTYAITVPPLARELVNTFPEVEETTTLYRPTGQVIVQIGDDSYNERNWFTTADQNFFKIFDFQFLGGDKTKALREPMSVVVTESTAKRFFGTADVVGKTIEVTGAGNVKVTGVIQDPPGNSHLRFDLLFSTLQSGQQWEQYLNNWDRFGAASYIVLKEGNAIKEIESRVASLLQKHWGPDAEMYSTSFQGIEEIYLHSKNIEAGVEERHGELSYIYIFSSMAIFVLFLAAINYINLTTSSATTRSKEIGVRKVAGAFKGQLVFQFLTETFVISVLAMLISLVVIDVSFPFFNDITGKDFELNIDTIGQYLPSMAAISFVIALLAGTYPAFFLSRLRPIVSLKAGSILSKSRIDLRSTLVVFQFAISITLIVSTLIIGKQLAFLQEKDLGFEQEGLMVIDINNRNVRTQFQAMKNEYLKLPGVEHVAVSSRVPGEWKNIAEVHVGIPTGDSLQSYFMGFDEDMMKTYRLKMAEGSYFTGNDAADSSSVIINVAAVNALSLENPIGTHIKISRGALEWEARVVGVVENFNFQSLHTKVAPMIIGFRNNPIQQIDYFTLRVSGDLNEVVAGATSVHEKFDTETPIEYHFLTEQMKSFYVAEQKAGMIFRMAGVLSTLIACLGLLGLLTHYLERKTKELAIRKVVGASSITLFFMVYKAFLKQIAIAFLMACPLAFYVMQNWLAAFEYRVPITFGVFFVAAAGVVAVLTITVAYHAIKAARFNPVKMLRSE